MLAAIEISHGVSRLTVFSCFTRVGLVLAAGVDVDPLGGVFVQVVDDDLRFFQKNSKLFKSKNRSRSEFGKAAVVGRVASRSD